MHPDTATRPRRSAASRLALGAAAAAAALTAPAGATSAGADPAPLVAVGHWTVGYTYQLDAARACRVGDADLAFENRSRTPVRIVAIAVPLPPSLHATVSSGLQRRSPGSTSGEVAAGFDLSAMGRGPALVPARGAVIAPYGRRPAWYFLVLRVRVHARVAGPWRLRGATVTYVSGSRRYVLGLDQSVVVSHSGDCAPPPGGGAG